MGGDSSVGTSTGWTLRGSNPGGGEIFHTRPNRSSGPPSLLYNGYRVIPGGKGGRCVWLTTYNSCSAETSRKSGALIYPEPLGPPRPVRDTFTFIPSIMIINRIYETQKLLSL